MKNISVVVTTSPRVVDYLPQTLQSLTAAGFLGVSVSADTKNEGNVANYYNAVRKALRINPGAEYVLVCEDDILVSRNLAYYIDGFRFPEPEANVGCLSLYCSTSDNQPQDGWFLKPVRPTCDDQQPWGRVFGALAMLWPRESAELFVSTKRPFEGRSKVDMLIGKWCFIHGKSLWVHHPSFVQHVGNASTMSILPKPSDAHVPLTPARYASSFVEDVRMVYPA